MSAAVAHIKSLLDQGHSVILRNEIVDYVGKSSARMKALMSFFFHEEWCYNQRASWTLSFIAKKHPLLIAPYLPQMVHNLEDAKHDAVIRNTLRLFEDIPIPEEVEGLLLDKCFQYVRSPQYAIAIRCFSITVLGKIALKYPDIKGEVIAELNEHLPHGSAGFKVRARRVIKLLQKK